LFADDNDRDQFLSLLTLYPERTGTRRYAWVLMDNHYHQRERVVYGSAGLNETTAVWKILLPEYAGNLIFPRDR
jgi:hypothetical protein